MSEKILYYIGAGASAQALPQARSVWGNAPIPEINGLTYELNQIDFESILKALPDGRYDKDINNMKARFRDLAAKADEFGDIDTYAKYLHLMRPGGSELEILKKTLSEFFSLKQLLLNANDKRYLPWLVTIMNRKTFPDNVKIISWNYDFQVELAAAKIGDLEDVNHKGTSFTYSPSMLLHFPTIDPTFSEFNRLSIIHLNGIAGFAKQKDFKTASIFQNKISGQADKVLSFITNENFQPQMHFAWERAQYHAKLMDHVKTMIEQTTIVVVIGYSFPFFNREYDKVIFQQLKEEKICRKIYYQDPILTGQQLKSQFNLNPQFDIVHIENTNNFHVPFEY